MLTTLGCSGTPHPRNSSADKFLRTSLSWYLTVLVGSGTEALDPGIPQLKNFSTEEFLGSGVPGHPSSGEYPRVVLGRPKYPAGTL